MRILKASLALVLGLSLAPAAAFAQDANSSVPPTIPKATVSGSQAPATAGSGANNSVPVGGPGVDKLEHKKYHKRAHKKFYGKHHDYTKSSPAKGPTGAKLKTTGTTD